MERLSTDHSPRATAILMIEQALALVDEHYFGVGAAPYLDMGLQQLKAEEQAAVILARELN
jgi:hypothetical protein